MAVRTGSNGQLRWRDSVVARVRSWSLTVNKDALETTQLGDFDRTYCSGLRGMTGTADIMYDPDELSATQLFNDINNNAQTALSNVEFILDSVGNNELSGSAVLTSVSANVQVGAVSACSVNFTITGPIAGGF